MKLVINFPKLNKNNTDIAGGKGASLGEMTNAGIPVPAGFVVTAGAFEQFLRESKLIEEIEAILEAVNHKEIHTVEAASEKIKGLILSREMPEEIKGYIQKHFKELGAEFVAVRSSATAEDGKTHAWAGQLDSYLNTMEKDLLDRVKHCWASLFTPRAIFYRFEKGLHTTKISVAVVVQKMVESEVSGIAFSVHPVTEDRNQLIIEAGFGLGEAIVSGQITPDSYVVEKDPRRIIDVTVSEQTKGLYKSGWKELGEEGKKQALNEKQILELSELILKIESHYGFPCDIEWAFEKGKFYIVQSRPITTLSEEKNKYRLIFASDGFSVMNAFNLFDAGYIKGGGVIAAENNNKLSLYIKKTDLDHYGKIGHEVFSSKEKTKKLMDDVDGLIKEISLIDESHKGKVESYSNTELSENLNKTSELSIKFISLYGLLESHHTFYTEDIINKHVGLNQEELKDRTIFDVIFKDSNLIKDQKIKELCENVATLAEFKLTTKKAMSNLFNGHSTLVRKAKKSFGLKDEEDIRLLSIKEIQEFLSKGFEREKFDKKVEERKDWFAMVYEKEGKLSVLTGIEAKKLIEEVKNLRGLQNKGELKGQIASVGKYTGRAVVIPYIRSTNDENYKTAFKEFKKGDILVTKNSVPEIIEIIKKAGAIITEEGGITCHGAIMSREFKVPGIVGVDGITEHIKTGDMIEVDAVKNNIRILK